MAWPFMVCYACLFQHLAAVEGDRHHRPRAQLEGRIFGKQPPQTLCSTSALLSRRKFARNSPVRLAVVLGRRSFLRWNATLSSVLVQYWRSLLSSAMSIVLREGVCAVHPSKTVRPSKTAQHRPFIRGAMAREIRCATDRISHAQTLLFERLRTIALSVAAEPQHAEQTSSPCDGAEGAPSDLAANSPMQGR